LARLVVFADYVCPFCYLAETQVARLRAEGVEVQGAAFELRPAGTPLPSLRERYMHDSWRLVIEPLLEELQVTMRFPTVSTRTRKAHEAAAWARGRDAFDRMHEAIYRAYWEDAADIGRIDVLTEIGAGVGLDRSELRVSLDIDQFTERVEQDRAWAARLQLGGVPAYLLQADGSDAGVELRTGMLRYDELKAWMTRE
jgi:predicted DsbA family dithiol-disulfide isomerase